MVILMVRSTLFTLVMMGSVLSLQGMSIKQVNISELVGSADRVFYGKCLSAESKFDPEAGIMVKEYRFLVLESLKGVTQGEDVVIRQIQMMGRSSASIPGVPSYRKGQELLLFLHADSRLGLTSPVGMSQGTFKPSRLQGGEIGFANPQHNQNLVQNLGGQSRAAQALSTAQLNLLASGQPVPLNMLREVVRQLDELNERQEGVVK